MASVVQILCNRFHPKFHTKRTLPLLNHLYNAQFSTPIQDPHEESVLPPENEETPMSEEELMKKRDISRLNPTFRAIVHNQPLPFTPRTTNRFDDSLAMQRHLYGKYGSSIGVNPAVCFMTKAEMEDFQSYEKTANPENILEVRRRKLEELAEEKRQYRIREEHYEKMMVTVEQHKQKIRERILSKMAISAAAKKKRDDLLEEVKRHFGYTIDPKDEKFQLMLEQKEKEQKKLQKEMKKKKREEHFMAKLASLESGQESTPSATDINNAKTSKKDTANKGNDESDSEDEK